MKKLGVTERSARDGYRRSINDAKKAQRLMNQSNDNRVHLEQVTNDERGTMDVMCSSAQIKTIEELIEYCKIDLDMWEIVEQRITKQEIWRKEKHVNMTYVDGVATGTVKDGGKLHTEPVIHIRIKLKRRKKLDLTREKELLIEAFGKQYAPTYEKIEPFELTDPVAVLISCPDAHAGALAWHRETGFDWNMNITEIAFVSSIDYLLGVTMNSFEIEEIIFPFGHDYFNVNSALNLTAAGTPQDEDGRWPRTYIRGRRLAQTVLDKMRLLAPVKVFAVPGNHDEQRLFYLADALQCRYYNDDRIIINNEPKIRKYMRYGATLIGMGHLAKEKESDIPALMALEAGTMWTGAEYRQFLAGHLHHDRKRWFLGDNDKQAVLIRRMPSLVPNNAWATSRGYYHLRKAVALVYHPKDGPVAEFTYNMRFHTEDEYKNDINTRIGKIFEIEET